MKIFNRYSVEEVKVQDLGLKKYINLETKLMLKSRGKYREKFGKAKVNIVERLANQLAVPGHRGKKHRIITRVSGKYTRSLKTVLKAFDLIETQTTQNPVQVFVKALENAAPRDEITTIEYGGARYPQAVDCSPLRRLDIALKNIIHGAQDKARSKKIKIAQALAQEIILAANTSSESFAFRKKIEIEKQADAAR